VQRSVLNVTMIQGSTKNVCAPRRIERDQMPAKPLKLMERLGFKFDREIEVPDGYG